MMDKDEADALNALKQKALNQAVGIGSAGIAGGAVGTAVNPYNHLQQLMAAHTAAGTAASAKLRFSVRTVVNGYIIEYAESEGQIVQEIVCKTLEELSAEVVRIVAANKLAGK